MSGEAGLLRLTAGPRRVVALAAANDLSRPAISTHLRRLPEAYLVCATDHGRKRRYALRPAGLAEVRVLLGLLTPPNGR